MAQNPQLPKQSSIIPPWWSCLLTTVAVVFCVVGLALAFIALGGTPPPPPATQLVILTAPPAALTQAAAPLGQIEPPVGAATRSAESSGAALVLSGPTLPAVIFTATPQQIAQGLTVRVVDVGDQQLNVRERPGIVDVAIAFRAPEGTLFTVGDGPSQGDGLTWWRIDDPTTGRSGWAASNYLEPVANP